MDYFTVLTNIGAQKIAAATAANTTIALTEIAIGDGNGAVPVPNITQTALVHEVFRTELSELKVDAVNTNQIIARAVIPASEGNFWVREVGIFDADGDLIAVGNYPETYKSILTQGAAKEIDLMVVLEVANTEVVQLVIDPSIVMASQEYVNGKVANKSDKSYVDTEILKAGSMVLSGVNGLRPDGTVSIVEDKVQFNGLAFGVAGFNEKGFKNFSYLLENTDFDGIVPDGDSHIFIDDSGNFGITQNELLFRGYLDYIRKYLSDNPHVYDVKTNKWFTTVPVSEKVVNGTFDLNTNSWIAGNSATLTQESNGMRIVNAGTSLPFAYQQITGLIIGKKYVLTFDGISTGGYNDYLPIIKIGTTINGSEVYNEAENVVGRRTGTNKYRIVFTATNISHYLTFMCGTSALSYYTLVDNISMFEANLSLDTLLSNRSYLCKNINASAGVPSGVEKYDFKILTEIKNNMAIVDFGTVSNNNRYVIDNPFGNENYDKCIVRAEININGKWIETGIKVSNQGYGYFTKALSNVEGIVVVTGINAVMYTQWNVTGSGDTTSVGSLLTSARCRVIVYKAGV